MDQWARSRRLTVIGVFIAAALAFISIVGFAVFYKTPTCTDNKMDGNERGVDCGGSCTTVCAIDAQKASVRFARVIHQSGRTDLIAYIDNPNTNAYAKNAKFDIDIYRADGHVLEKHVLLPLPANLTTPLFLPGIANADVQQAFVSFASGSPAWTNSTGIGQALPKVSNIAVSNASVQPRITATVTNPIAYPEKSVPFVATVFAADGTVIAASQTIAPLIPPQGSAQVVFTWNEPFEQPYSRVEITPLLALPTLVP